MSMVGLELLKLEKIIKENQLIITYDDGMFIGAWRDPLFGAYYGEYTWEVSIRNEQVVRNSTLAGLLEDMDAFHPLTI